MLFNGDIYLLLWIIGDLDEVVSLRLFGNCCEVMVGDGWVVVIEWIILVSELLLMLVFWDVYLFMVCVGCYCIIEEVVDLFGCGGFVVEWIVDLLMEICMIVVVRV